MPRSRPARTVLEVAVARAGIRKGTKALGFAAAWSITAQQLGRPPTMAEYVADWKMSTPTAYREWGIWREVFPEWETPEPVWRRAQGWLESRDRARGLAVIAAVPAG